MSLPPELTPPPAHVRPWARLRTYFLTGVVVVGPLAVTLYIAVWFVNTVDGWVRPFVPERFLPDGYVHMHVPGFGVVIAAFALTSLGFLAANFFGRALLRAGERLLDAMPVVRSIYKSAKQLFETVFGEQGTGFRRVGLVEYPMEGRWSLVFLSSAAPPSVERAVGGAERMVSVFMPCAPNPTAGFYFYLPASKVIEIPMSPEDAMKIIMSAGLIQPEALAKPVAAKSAAIAAQGGAG
ncbi:MAG: DUF502 domain-containing protein [Hyphomicrobiales bacterium]|nr:DUF502 domain-containing protein [Hyphomicrobiales bacterium]MDE2018057.1 DUF502 domain-containing protein [Hyphomicrobiales bacterium]